MTNYGFSLCSFCASAKPKHPSAPGQGGNCVYFRVCRASTSSYSVRVKPFQANLTLSEELNFFMQWAFASEDIHVYSAVKMYTCSRTNTHRLMTLMVFGSDNVLGGSSALQNPWWRATKATCGCQGLGLLFVCPPACALKGRGAAWPLNPHCCSCQSSSTPAATLTQCPPSSASSLMLAQQLAVWAASCSRAWLNQSQVVHLATC